MAIATGTALGIAAVASAGAQVYGAHKAASASKESAKQQSQSADRAMRYTEDALGPYVNKGREAISTLGRLTAAPPGARFAAPDPTLGPVGGGGQPAKDRAIPRTPLGPGQAGGSVFSRFGRPAPQGPVPGAPSDSYSDDGTQGQRVGSLMAARNAGPVGGGGEMVTLRAPDGSIEQVPAQFADAFIQRGAQMVR